MAKTNNDKTVKEVAEEEATTVETPEEVSPKGDAETIAPEGEESDTAINVVESNVTVGGTGAVKVEEAKEVVEPAFEDGDTRSNPLTKMLDEFAANITTALQKSVEDNKVALESVTTQFEKKFDDLATKHNELSDRFGTLNTKIEEVNKSIDDLGGSGAFKKSADLGGSEETSSLQKSNEKKVWKGSIFSSAVING